MKRAWSTIYRVFPISAAGAVAALARKFPDTRFKLGRQSEYYGFPYVPVLALVPYPHPNDTTAEIIRFADSLPRYKKDFTNDDSL